MRLVERFRRGDTLVEVMFSITIFALIAVLSISLMNGGVATSQTSLEIIMARNEIDAQSEALRFIHNSYLAEKELNSGEKQFTKLWDELITRNARVPSDDLVNSFNNLDTCAEAYNESMSNYHYFILNTRLIQPEKVGFDYAGEGVNNYDALLEHIIVTATQDSGKFQTASLFPRIVYSRWGGGGDNNEEGALKEADTYRGIERAEGIWVIAVRGGENASDTKSEPEYYDFYIRTCWNAPGRKVPSTIGTITRLYNPEVID